MDERILHDIAELVRQESRLSFAGHKRAVLKSRLDKRLDTLGMADLAGYRELLRCSGEEVAVLLDQLTTNETYFFRNPHQFRYLREVIMPALEAAQGGAMMLAWGGGEKRPSPDKMRLRVLCAGCATGEEPYSIAMTFLEGLRYPKAWDIEILAGDLSSSCLRTAMAGAYETEKLKGIPLSWLAKYTQGSAAGAVFNEEVKRLIRFIPLNLKDIMEGAGFPDMAPGFAGFDLIFCRNVMIYFAADSQQQLVDTLPRWLLPGGYLFTGDAEPLHLFAHDLRVIHAADCFIYQKTETEQDEQHSQ